MNHLELSRAIGTAVKDELRTRMRERGFVGDTNHNPLDLKSMHEIDVYAERAIRAVLRDVPCQVIIESSPLILAPQATFTIFIDAIDGSLNWDRGVGDPCIAIAIADKVGECKFSDLTFGYVEGLRSGDVYFTQEDKVYFESPRLGYKAEIKCSANRQHLKDATVYLRSGYSLAEKQMKAVFPLFLLARDIRSIENTAMEICEIARNAADLLVEAREISDFFNLLAYPILSQAGGVLCNLRGEAFADQIIDINGQYDFIATTNRTLLDETLAQLDDFRSTQEFQRNGLLFRYTEPQ